MGGGSGGELLWAAAAAVWAEGAAVADVVLRNGKRTGAEELCLHPWSGGDNRELRCRADGRMLPTKARVVLPGGGMAGAQCECMSVCSPDHTKWETGAGLQGVGG